MKTKYDYKYEFNKYFVESVIDFLKLISDKTNRLPKSSEYIYRGQADSEWDLLPSIAVPLNGNNNLLKFESKMVNEFLKRRPNEFHDIKDPIDILAKMQHYGLPTRLLDVTFNPLVALYFACKDDNIKDKDGEIFMFMKSKTIPFNSNYDKVVRAAWGMCDFYGEFFERISQIDFLQHATANSIITEKHAREYKNFYAKHIDLLLNTEPIVIMPNIYAERQYRQRAAFLLFQNDIIKDEIIKRTEDFQNYFFIQSIKDFKDNVIRDMKMRIIVRADKKNIIINQLEEFGINEEFLFVEMEYTAKYIKRQFLSRR